MGYGIEGEQTRTRAAVWPILSPSECVCIASLAMAGALWNTRIAVEMYLSFVFGLFWSTESQRPWHIVTKLHALEYF